MKKYFTIILAFIIFILTLVNGWFLDQIVDRSIFWGFVPSVLLVVLFIICFRDAIKDLKENKSKNAGLALIILFININAILFIPFRSIRVDVDFNIFMDERQYLINKIESWDIIPNDDGEISIHSLYSGISSNRRVHVYEHTDDTLTVGFYVTENMPFKTAMLIYTTESKDKIKSLIDTKSEINIKEMKKNWYYINYDK